MDLSAVKAKLQKLNKKTSRTENLWKPEEGSQTIRILPYKHQKEFPFMEVYFHYGLGKRSYVSPKTIGEPDPIEELAQKLWNSGDKESTELAKKLFPKMRTYVPVLVRGKEKEGVKFWGFGKMVYQELLGYAEDEDYGNYEDPNNGRDFTVDFVKGERATDNKTTIRPRPKETPISEDKDILALAGDQPNLLEDIFQIPTYDELKEVLENYLNPADSDEENAQLDAMGGGVDAAKEKITPSEEKSTNAKTVEKVENVEKAFDDLFND